MLTTIKSYLNFLLGKRAAPPELLELRTGEVSDAEVMDAIQAVPTHFIVTPISGRSGRVQFAGVNWNFDDWQGTISTVTGTITGFEDQDPITGRTSENRSDGNDDLKVTVHGFIDQGQMPSGGVKQGTILTNAKFFNDKNLAGRCVSSTRMIVRQIQYHAKQSDPAQAVTIEIENAGGKIIHPV